jgi:hypothetical protein
MPDPGQQSLRSHPPTERSRCWCQAGTKPLAGIHAFALASIAWIIPRADNSSNVPANRRKAIPPSLFDSDASKEETNRSTAVPAPACRASAYRLALRSRLECPWRGPLHLR